MKSRVNNSSTRSAPNEILSTQKNSPPPNNNNNEFDNCNNSKFICEFYENDDDNIETIKPYANKTQPKISSMKPTEKSNIRLSFKKLKSKTAEALVINSIDSGRTIKR